MNVKSSSPASAGPTSAAEGDDISCPKCGKTQKTGCECQSPEDAARDEDDGGRLAADVENRQGSASA